MPVPRIINFTSLRREPEEQWGALPSPRDTVVLALCCKGTPDVRAAKKPCLNILFIKEAGPQQYVVSRISEDFLSKTFWRKIKKKYYQGSNKILTLCLVSPTLCLKGKRSIGNRQTQINPFLPKFPLANTSVSYFCHLTLWLLCGIDLIHWFYYGRACEEWKNMKYGPPKSRFLELGGFVQTSSRKRALASMLNKSRYQS